LKHCGKVPLRIFRQICVREYGTPSAFNPFQSTTFKSSIARLRLGAVATVRVNGRALFVAEFGRAGEGVGRYMVHHGDRCGFVPHKVRRNMSDADLEKLAERKGFFLTRIEEGDIVDVGGSDEPLLNKAKYVLEDKDDEEAEFAYFQTEFALRRFLDGFPDVK
jgi:hypothetical protein